MVTQAKASKKTGVPIPPQHDWRTTDQDEVNRRRLRAREELFRVANSDASHPIFSNFRVHSSSGMVYSVEIRDLRQRHFACDCTDFRSNGLGTCKHVEAVLLYLQARFRRLAQRESVSNRIDVVPDHTASTLRIERGRHLLPRELQAFFDKEGLLRDEDPDRVLQLLTAAALPQLRISQEVAPWLEARRQAEERIVLRREYEQKVQSGEWPAQETLVPLFPYQREGMLHLAFTERALLADEMGLGKTIQAIAACALLHRLGKASRVLVVAPASLKTEWEEQIQRFTPLPYQLVFGARGKRRQAYEAGTFFTIVNYEQMLHDALEVNTLFKPDVVVLDEAQRIKNWNTKTAQAVKRLRSRYAFVLTGTPIENRIDELHSLMSFLNPSVLGPLFRFNRDFYELDERGRPAGYRNLDQLHARIKPYMLRRRKADVETELPERTVRTYFVPLSAAQKDAYAGHDAEVARLGSIARRRPLTQREQDKLMRELAMMRMVCDTNFILDPRDRICPKLDELEKILEECRENPDVKVIVFSEWERMLQLVRELCDRLNLGYAWHTGTVPQRRRRSEIQLFKSDPQCRVFLSTDSGSTGLNLQNASVVINCDLPWNPARLEQRIARAWRKHQTRAVTVIHLVSEHTIEHRMLGTLSMKQSLADGVLDLRGDLESIQMTSGRQAFLARLEQLAGPASSLSLQKPATEPMPADRPLAFSQRAREILGSEMVRCDECYPAEGSHSTLVVVVAGDADLWRERLAQLHQQLFAEGTTDPLVPVHLEVIDRVTDEALKRMKAAGLIAFETRAVRSLFPAGDGAVASSLSEAERQQAMSFRQQALRKLKMASLLNSGDFLEESRLALLDTILHLAQAAAVEQRLPKPERAPEAMVPPLYFHWGEAGAMLRDFISNETAPRDEVLRTLQTHLSAFAAPALGHLAAQAGGRA